METIFIHEADESIMEVLALTLQMEGYQVVCSAQCGEEILPRIARMGPALVILDFKISGEVSILTCGLIKQRWPSLPVLAISCNNKIKETFRQHGFDGYIEKPFDISHLLAKIRFHIQSVPRHQAHPLNVGME